jgi:predicted DNA-binding protein
VGQFEIRAGNYTHLIANTPSNNKKLRHPEGRERTRVFGFPFTPAFGVNGQSGRGSPEGPYVLGFTEVDRNVLEMTLQSERGHITLQRTGGAEKFKFASPPILRQRLTAIPGLPTLGHMEVRLTPDLEAKLNRLSAETGRAKEDLVQDAMAGYLAELSQVRVTLDARYSDIKSGRDQTSGWRRSFRTAAAQEI